MMSKEKIRDLQREQVAKYKEYVKREENKYYERKEAGICVRCGKNKISSSKSTVFCDACFTRIKEVRKPLSQEQKDAANKRQRDNYDFLRSNGICVCCGKEKAVHGKCVCEKCRIKRLELAKKYKKRKKDKVDGQIYVQDN